MRYYVISDVHSFYSETMQALSEKGFFEDKSPHKLIVCGDLFDRGSESVKMQNFICELLKNDDVILVRGNHEDLILDLIRDAKQLFGYGIEHTHHWSNGTVKTVTDLTGTDVFTDDYRDIINKLCATPYLTEIIPKMLNYYETKKYVFVHGWIPCNNRHGWSANYYSPIEDWREAGESSWKEARWINGMLAYSYEVTEKDKTIVCGHWHCSWGHCRLEGKCSEFGKDSDFSPFYADGIIAIDGCTAYSGRVNCIVLEDENIKKRYKMSWDISLTDRVTGEVLHSDSPHMMRGGTFMLGGTTELWLNITYNYGKIYRRDSVFGKDGIGTIFGKTGLESIPLLEKAINALGDDVSKNYWEATEGNAKRPLVQLLTMAKMRPDGIWKGE